MMALRMRGSKDVKKRSYYVWYLGSREAKGVDAMPGAIAYLLERERLQEPFKVTLQVRIFVRIFEVHGYGVAGETAHLFGHIFDTVGREGRRAGLSEKKKLKNTSTKNERREKPRNRVRSE